jgi:hypothetical protein
MQHSQAMDMDSDQVPSLAQLAKCHKTTTRSSIFRFQIFSDKLTALTLVLGFLGFCVPLLSASHALQIDQSYLVLEHLRDDHVIGVLTSTSGQSS